MVSWNDNDLANNQLNWNFVGNTANFGNLLDGHHILWDGDFNGDGRADILFHFSDYQNWFLGRYDLANNQLNWNPIGNTNFFGCPPSMTVIYIDFLLVILMEMVERILSFTSLVMEIGFLEHMMLQITS